MPKFKQGEVVILNAAPDGKFVVFDDETWRLSNPAPSSLHGALAILLFKSIHMGCWCVLGGSSCLIMQVHESQLLKA